MDYILIISGFAVLVLGANLLVDGASSLAKKLKISDLIIGLTVVAFGTSAPELVVNVIASVKPNATDIAISNVIGSNIVNIFIILGFSALFHPIKSEKTTTLFDIPLSFFAIVVTYLLAFTGDRILSRTDGLVMLGFFIAFIYFTTRRSIKHPLIPLEENIKIRKTGISILMISCGLAALIGGAEIIVPSAIRIAENLGISQAVIGLTIVALGTSLPELATSVVAAIKKNSDIALGNIIGSNIFNIFLILGVSSVIRPLPIYRGIGIDLTMGALGSVMVFVFVFGSKSHSIKKWQGLLLIFIYLMYAIFKIF
ncbi:MAG: sodium:calcium antiporter [Paludibacteraceae bacterium]|jgi:cation:H+ antiporter|nr:sodium:calcium antiporter [Paludibacteraceae bacterium]OPZ03073.1 MAG: Inner membrane protein YrbG [Bacteroidetes bacterium ADurb.BinA395]MBP8966530.1 sodium:calcium antiporter [Paludibacteraceae bacterium]HOF98082.1 sodium:calcium antiporter [Paludibacteraceae bacterium]HON01995.1 sodium:calcium antiporter [Paludibacteraceae bacterium]